MNFLDQYISSSLALSGHLPTMIVPEALMLLEAARKHFSPEVYEQIRNAAYLLAADYEMVDSARGPRMIRQVPLSAVEWGIRDSVPAAEADVFLNNVAANGH